MIEVRSGISPYFVMLTALMAGTVVCVCVILYLISRYMQPKRVMTAASPRAVAFFIYRFSLAQSQSEDQNTRTGLTSHSGAPTAPTKRKRPHAPKAKPN